MSQYLGETVINCNKSKDEYAIEFISRYSSIDGAHHKQWCLDQVARILLNTPVIVKEASWDDGLRELRYSTGEPSSEYLEWVCADLDDTEVVGIAP